MKCILWSSLKQFWRKSTPNAKQRQCQPTGFITLGVNAIRRFAIKWQENVRDMYRKAHSLHKWLILIFRLSLANRWWAFRIRRCMGCHGNGDGRNATSLSPKCREFSNWAARASLSPSWWWASCYSGICDCGYCQDHLKYVTIIIHISVKNFIVS